MSKQNIRLFINGEEHDFDRKFSYKEHPYNTTTITLNNVIKKNQNVYPQNTQNVNINSPFSLGELYDGDKLIFFGIVQATGRLSLMPNSLKTISIEMADVRKWLNYLKPINKKYFNVDPSTMVSDLIQNINEPFIQIGKLEFTNNDPIQAYNTQDKSLYQLLKEVIGPITQSILYFTIENHVLKINYKNLESFNTVSPIELNTLDQEFLKTYKVLDVQFSSNNDNYSNIINYSSDNIVSNLSTKEELSITADNLTLKNSLIKINIENTYMLNSANQKLKAVIINKKYFNEDIYYDFIYEEDSNTLEVRPELVNSGYKLVIEYYSKVRWSIELEDNLEISKVSNLSQTSGKIYCVDKFNDITSSSDLIRKAKHKLNISSKPRQVITLSCREKLWDILEGVKVTTPLNDINGIYYLKNIKGTFQANDDELFKEYEYELTQILDFDDFINYYDNQSYRSNPVYNVENIYDVPDVTEGLNGKMNLICDLFSLDNDEIKYTLLED